MKSIRLLVSALATLPGCALALGDVAVTVNHHGNDAASTAFRFAQVPSPARADAGGRARFTVIDGTRDPNGGDLDQLNDGRLPTEEDQPSANFFFRAGTDGGRLRADLGSVIEVKQVNTYSWHPATRGPQVYALYASEGMAAGFEPAPKRGTDPETCGWKLIAQVDTRPKSGEPGGQYGVSISDSTGLLGRYRYLLFDCSRTESDDGFGNTFYSEIDVVTPADQEGTVAAAAEAPGAPFVTHSTDGACEISIDTSGAPDLKAWAETRLAPVLTVWYPRIVALLPSEGFTPPKRFSVTIKPGRGVAATGGTRITANATWLQSELHREAIGSIVHEVVHVVQQYGGRRRGGTRPPGWLVEGIPDYIRWYLFEPQSHGAEISARNLARARYDGMYRVSANFLNYVVQNHGAAVITRLNAACRQGQYAPELWTELTGKTVEQLNEEWKAALEKQIAAAAAANTLTEAEQTAGWKLLFDGKDFNGWHNFKREGVRPGWQVRDGALVCADPHNAGDLVTTEQFGAFELQLDYNITEAGNSGIMYHVTDQGGAAWATGPEFQLEDNVKAADEIRCGWLYGLYQPPDDPRTGKPLDATKPVGQWNHVRLLISAEKCEHEINGVKYFDYVLGSDDFNARVARSKFARMPGFAKSNTGYLSLQGDHGQVSFRNIKMRPITTTQ